MNYGHKKFYNIGPWPYTQILDQPEVWETHCSLFIYDEKGFITLTPGGEKPQR